MLGKLPKMRILFMGSPEIAVPSLKALLESGEKVVGVVTQPDKPAGRGREVTPPPVALFAREKKLPLLQPVTLKNNPDFLKTLRELAPDLIVVVAYGKILPRELLDLPPRKCLNVHFSLLPKYRGAAPVQWALINDEEETGVTTFLIGEKVDAGPIFLQKKVLINSEDTTEILGQRLALVGAEILAETVQGIKENRLDPIPQNDRLATMAPLLKKEDGKIDWGRKATTIANQVRGMNPWPGTFTHRQGLLLKVFHAEAAPGRRGAQPGEVLVTEDEGIEVACGHGALRIRELQIEGGRRMSATDFLKGHAIKPGERLGV